MSVFQYYFHKETVIYHEWFWTIDSYSFVCVFLRVFFRWSTDCCVSETCADG